ncbi:MAG: CAP domain-containing protein [Shimia sp.]
MTRRAMGIGAISLLAACGARLPQQRPMTTAGAQTGATVRYTIGPEERADVQFRMLDGLNALRQAGGLAHVQLDAQLNAAAATHAQDMRRQNRPWHFGSDGSSPVDRLNRVGYPGALIGEAISETFETELETLAAWMRTPDVRGVLMDPRAREMGFDFSQEPNGKIWWTLVLGSRALPSQRPQSAPVAGVSTPGSRQVAF